MATVLGDAPSLYYRLDETAGTLLHDLSGYNNNGTLSGGILLGQPGRDNAVVTAFSGAGGNIASATNLSVTGTTVSVEAWLWWNGVYNGNWSIPITFGSNYDLAFNNNASFGVNTGNSDILGVASAPLLRTWTHVVATVPRSGTPSAANAQLFLNGVAQTIGVTTGTPVTQTVGQLYLGGFNGSNFYYGGLMSDVAVYGYPLSAAQVKAHYNAGQTRLFS